jgi:hypothetical protein
MKKIKLIFAASAILLSGFVAGTPILKSNSNLKPVYDVYYQLKDALVRSDGELASKKSTELIQAILQIKPSELDADVSKVWSSRLNDLILDAEHISETKDVSHQRDHFITLSNNLSDVIKNTKVDETTYLQFCPMANKGKGAYWLSKEKAIKNPYFGSQMLTCGSTKQVFNNN